ncbi:ketosamine-3-kinase-like isoform X2 [Lepidochelys kempii]|uniref:ketosamine-3-kinase-like isoform X2 n=1 Tax=Lepidochelys kempii TaxID=8472 RepID=UPI003C6EA5EC
MEAALKRELGTSVLRPTGHSGGGCISQGQSYDTDGGRVYVKSNSKAGARRMFEGEMESLSAILETQTVKVPKPIKVIDVPGGSTLFVMEHLEMRSLNRHSAKLGTQLADLHLHNQKLGEKLKKEGNTVGKSEGQTDIQFVDRFGFHTVTCCGYLPQVNDWQNDWVSFYARQRIQPQMDMIEKNSGDREARELWAQLQFMQVTGRYCRLEDWVVFLASLTYKTKWKSETLSWHGLLFKYKHRLYIQSSRSFKFWWPRNFFFFLMTSMEDLGQICLCYNYPCLQYKFIVIGHIRPEMCFVSGLMTWMCPEFPLTLASTDLNGITSDFHWCEIRIRPYIITHHNHDNILYLFLTVDCVLPPLH